MRNLIDGSAGEQMQSPVIVLGNGDFQREVLEKLGRLEAKVDMIVGNGQPGRMRLAEDRLVILEKNDLRRTVYDRIVVAGITFALTFVISAMIAWRSYFLTK
jgi:hypothetical protein